MYGFRVLWDPGSRYVLIGTAMAIVLLYRLGQFAWFSGQIQWGYDFSAYWQAGRNVLLGADVYSAEQLAGTYSPQQQYLYLYPPVLAVATTPLSAWFEDYRIAAWFWAAIQAVVAACSVAALTAVYGIRGRDALLLVGAAFAFPPIVGELVMGNVHLLLLGLLTVAWIGLRGRTTRGELVAGVAIGAATMIKVFPGLMLLWFVATGRWRAAVAAAATAAFLVVVTLPAIGFDPWLQFPRAIANLGPPVDTTDTLAPAVWLAPLIGPWPARVLVTAVGVVLVVWAASSRPLEVSYAIAVLVSLLIAPALYHHYLAIAFLPLLLAWLSKPTAVLAVAYLAMWGGTQPGLGEAAWIVNRFLPTLGAVLLLTQLLAWKSVSDPDSPKRAPRMAPA